MSSISKEDEKAIREVVARLMEHYDSVRIFVTRHVGQNDVTESFETGGGNLLAQLGQVQQWLTIQNRYAEHHADKAAKEDDEE